VDNWTTSKDTISHGPDSQEYGRSGENIRTCHHISLGYRIVTGYRMGHYRAIILMALRAAIIDVTY
jgi:hypothetical protein